MILIENIVKRYGNHTALKGINFEVKKGEILGLLGPNGAGKSTTMNIITGYISSTEGSVNIGGFDILKEPLKAKRRIGYLPETPPLYMDMTVNEYLNFVCKIKKVEKSKIKEHIEKIIEKIKLKEVENRLIKNLSKGYKQRVGLAQAIIGDPDVLILDEPTVGLDPNQIIEIRNLIKELGEQHTIILSSHILSEVSALCDRIVIINKGLIVAEGNPDELSKNLSYTNKINLRIKGTKTSAKDAIKHLDKIRSINILGENEPGTVDIEVEAKKDYDLREELFNCFKDSNLPILMMKSSKLTLEQIFLEVTQDEKEDLKNA